MRTARPAEHAVQRDPAVEYYQQRADRHSGAALQKIGVPERNPGAGMPQQPVRRDQGTTMRQILNVAETSISARPVNTATWPG
jgi:hypothetical protein